MPTRSRKVESYGQRGCWLCVVGTFGSAHVWSGPPSHPQKSQGNWAGISGGGPRTRGLNHQLPTTSQAFPRMLLCTESGLTGREAGGSREQDSTHGSPAGFPGESEARLTRKETGSPRGLHIGVFGHCTGTPLQSCFLYPRQNWVAQNRKSQFHWPVQKWVETRSWQDEASVRMAYGSQLLHREKIPDYGRKEKNRAWIRKM